MPESAVKCVLYALLHWSNLWICTLHIVHVAVYPRTVQPLPRHLGHQVHHEGGVQAGCLTLGQPLQCCLPGLPTTCAGYVLQSHTIMMDYSVPAKLMSTDQ